MMCDVFTKYEWVKPLKDKKAITVLHGFTYGLIKEENITKALSKNG